MRTRMEEIAGERKNMRKREKKRELGEKRRDRIRDTVMYETESEHADERVICRHGV